MMETRTQLSENQVSKLFDFVTSKYVRYEDLKYELVDHLASSIEDIQDENSDTSFDKALKETYSKFPITGFSNFVAEKQKALSRYWMEKFFSYYIEFFKLPKIILLIALAYLIYNMFQLIPHCYMIVCLTVFAFSLMIKGFIYVKKVSKRSEKYMFMATYYGHIITANTFFFYFIIPTNFELSWDMIIPFWTIIILSVILSLATLLDYAVTKVFPKMLEEEINTKYSHLNIKLAL